MSNIMNAKDAVSASLAECFVTIEGNRYCFMQAINLEASFEKNKSEVPILGKTGKGNKSTGWKGTGSATFHYNTSIFRELMMRYKNTGEDIYFDIQEIKAYMMQECIDNCGCGYSTQGAIKNLWGQLDKYAMELDIITKMNSVLIHAAPIPPSNKKPFTEEEIKAVWELKDEPDADTILILIYSGFRISELLSLETEKINLGDIPYFQGGVKTKAGKDRIVPIHPLILDFVKARVQEGNKYLISVNGKKLSNSQYYIIWNQFMKKLNQEHTPHECRHTFRSRLDSAGANKVCIDLMMGHKSTEVGERIYTHKTIEELQNALALVTS